MDGTTYGELLREWRQRRRLSQLALACDAEVSTRHLSFLESGRAQPSREMVVRLAEQLDVPLRERNRLLVAAGYAPAYHERPLDDDAMRAATRAVDQVLRAHEPFPGLAIDRHWTMVRANRVIAPLLEGVAPALLAPPVNVIRLSLHPDGLLPRIANADEWRAHILSRLGRQVRESGDATLAALLDEVRGFDARVPLPTEARRTGHDDVIVPLQLHTPVGVLSFISTTLLFGSPTDVTLSELAVELFYPADDGTAEALRALATGARA
jgi:transcriptional regulator with XRE-family HTH domain